MLIQKAIFAVALVPFIGSAQAASFENISSFTVKRAEGNLNVTCNDNVQPVQVTNWICSRTFVLPKDAASLISSPGIQANTANITISQPKNKPVSISVPFDSVSGSTPALLLYGPGGIFTLGTNKISYDLTFGRKVIERGKFNVDVIDGYGVACPSDYITTTDLNSCSVSTNVCNDYYLKYGHCE